MRVITGKARGIRLETLEGLDIRPTADKVKGAVFSMIQFEIEERNFLDLFAGSGQMGIEALSRGAAQATFVDKNKSALLVARKNLEKTKLLSFSRLIHRSAEDFLASTGEKFDIVFVDPPYHQGLIPPLLEMLSSRLSPNGIVLCETDDGEPLPEKAAELHLEKQSRYGRTIITVYKKVGEANGTHSHLPGKL